MQIPSSKQKKAIESLSNELLSRRLLEESSRITLPEEDSEKKRKSKTEKDLTKDPEFYCAYA